MKSERRGVLTALTGFLIMMTPTAVRSAEEIESAAAREAKILALAERAYDYLAQSQADDGSFSKDSGTGVTSIVAAGLLQNGKQVDDPVVSKALQYLEGFVHEDGGIYQPGSTHKNYETCIAIVAFHHANLDKRYDKLLADAEKFIKEQQWDHGESIDEANMAYGGSGYGSHSRPDLSNTSFLIDTLHILGRGDDDPAIQRALIFVSRCQNLDTKYNDSEFADKVNDGGFYYTIAAGGSSQAGTTDDGALRSYGSMTYAGLKSMIFAGVNADDERVKAAYDWLRDHYTLEENPNMGDSGLYYYYHTFAKALDAVGKPELEVTGGQSHNWRDDLVDELAERQQENGSWVNSNERWLEGDPNLVTGYVLLALSYCR